MSTRISRCRVLASAVVAAGLCLAGTAALASPTQAAKSSCDQFYPVAELTAEQPVTGLTVTQGDDPTSGAFTGTIIGVLTDGIEPDVDMVMATLTSPQIDVSGIWQGMSGSPVYALDGRLIGAVAYTLAWGPTPVAGITPWQDMQAYAGTAAPTRIAVGAATARRIAQATDVTAAQATQGFVELRAPRVVVGLGARGLARAQGRPYLRADVAPAGRAATGPQAEDMVAGANLVATESTGDIVSAALGTVTSVCVDRVVGFGHPMEFVGKSSFGMAGADTLYIQTDTMGPSFKVATIGQVIGAISQDRMTGIAGDIGAAVTQFPVTSDMSYTGATSAHRTGTSNVQFQMAAASTTFYELMANHQRVLDAYQGGTEAQSWKIVGHTAAGQFTMVAGNRYTDASDIAQASAFDLADLLWMLTHVPGVTLESVQVGSQITDNTTVLQIRGLQQRLAGTWVTVDRTHPVQLTAGKTGTLRLRYAGGIAGRLFTVAVPAKAAGARGALYVQQSPQWWFEENYARTLSGVTRLVRTMPRNDQATYSLYVGGETGEIQVAGLTPAETKVVTGHGSFRVVVR